MATEYSALSNRIYSDFPIFGSCIRQRAAVALSKDKSPHAVRILAEAVVRSGDRKVITIALEALRNLRDRDSVNAFCQVWAESRHKDLTTILKNRRYVSSESKFLVLSALKVGALDKVKKGEIDIVDFLLTALVDRDVEIARAARICIDEIDNLSIKAVCYFLLGEWEKYEDLDFDHNLLSNAYHSANEEIKRRISNKARIDGRIEWIKILTGGKKSLSIENISPNDWSSFADILVSKPERKEIWRFLCNAPAIWSKKLLENLDNKSQIWATQNEQNMMETLFQLAKTTEDEFFSSSPYLRTKKLDTGDGGFVTSMAITSDSQLLAWNSTVNDLIVLWNLPAEQEIKLIHGNNSAWNLAISPNGLILASTGYHDKFIYPVIRLWSLPDGKLLKTLRGNLGNKGFDSLVISPNSKILVSGYDNTIRLWSLPDGKHLKKLTGHDSSIESLAITPDGQILVSGSSDNTIRLWSLPDGKHLKTIEKCTGDLAITPDGKILVSGYTMWSLADGKHLKTLEEHNGEHIAITPDGKTLISASNKTILLRSLPDGQLQAKMTNYHNIGDLVVSPDGNYLVVGGDGYSPPLQLELPIHIPINKLDSQSIVEIEVKARDSSLEEGSRNAFKFTLALIRLRQQFDIDIEDSSNDIASSEFDIEIDG